MFLTKSGDITNLPHLLDHTSLSFNSCPGLVASLLGPLYVTVRQRDPGNRWI